MTVREMDKAIKEMHGECKYRSERYVLYMVNYTPFTANYSKKELTDIVEYGSIEDAIQFMEEQFEKGR